MTRERVLWVALAVAVCAAWWFSLPPPAAPVGVFVPASVASEVKNVQKTDVPAKKIRAYPAAAKAKVGMSAPEQQADNIYIVSASKLASDPHPRTVTAVYDSATGEVRQDVRIDPYPWLAAESRGSVWAGVGLNERAERIGRIAVEYDVLQVKALHLGARATIDTDGRAFTGIGVAYKF